MVESPQYKNWGLFLFKPLDLLRKGSVYVSHRRYNMLNLVELSTEEIKEEWFKAFKIDPPKFTRRQFLEKYLIWEMQKKRLGGLKRETQTELNVLIKAMREGKPLKESKTLIIKEGTKLIREYQGRQHEVIVQEKGYLYQDKAYRSLSAIAREITGTRWNGRIFFGVRS
ncbi:MAG: DUF2924 domain-containing protein [Alphaproteobacteria bacterium]